MAKPTLSGADAIEIVMSLASENIIGEEEAAKDPAVLQPERERQLAALAEVKKLLKPQACTCWRCLRLNSDPYKNEDS